MSDTRPPAPGPAGPAGSAPQAPAEPAPLAPLPRRRIAVPAQRWAVRTWDALSASLPVVLLAVLAGLSWWLVRSTPPPPEPKAVLATAHLPDYTLDRFELRGHAEDGRLLHRLEGEALRHYPDRDALEIDAVRLLHYEVDGGQVTARADRGLVETPADRVTLRGRVEAEQRPGAADGRGPLTVRGEVVLIEPKARRLSSPEPVRLQQDGLDAEAGRLAYDHAERAADLLDGVRGRLLPRPGATAGAARTAPPAALPKPAPAPARAQPLRTRPAR